MSIAAVQELIAKQALDAEVMSHFMDFTSGEVTLRFESEYWDYKRDLPDTNAAAEISELAADVLAFHNTRGGYIIYGITDDFTPLGVHLGAGTSFDSNILNSKLKKFVGDSFRCRYSCIPLNVAGSRKSFAVLFIPPRTGVAIKAGCKGQRFAEGALFLRVNDRKKPAESEAEFLMLYSPPEPEVIVGSHQLKTYSPRPGIRLFIGDYATTGFVGDVTRKPLVDRVVEELVYGKWDVILLKGVGGVGKTAIGIEVTNRLANAPELQGAFGGIVSLSGKSEQLTPYARSAITPEITDYDNFLRSLLLSSRYEGDIPGDSAQRKNTLVDQIVEHNILLFIDNFETIETKDSRISRFLCELPAGCKTLITSRHLPKDLPALPIEVPELDRKEAELLARAEAVVQHLDAVTTDKYLSSILDISGHIPLAIKWIIGCSKNSEHLLRLIDDHKRNKPSLANLCEFCFTFEFNLLSKEAQKALVAMPIFRSAPSLRDLSIATGVDMEDMTEALDELVNYSLIIREYNSHKDENVYRILKLTEGFAEARLHEFGDFEKHVRRRLKAFYGSSLPVLLDSARDMLDRGVSPGAVRKYVDDEILDREPDNPRALYLRAQTYEHELAYSAAIRDYQAALGHITNSPELAAEIALRLTSLWRHDPQGSKQELISTLERAYVISEDPRVALDVAKHFDLAGQKARATEYYEKVYQTAARGAQPAWDESFAFLCKKAIEERGSKSALDFVREAARKCPHSKIVQNWEKRLLEELGHLRYKGSRSSGKS